jgi:secreted Zn-dependent insulinase-like peptidase
MYLKSCVILLASITMFSSAAFAKSINKSPNDKRSYQSFTLANKMQVLIISDPEAKKAAASLNLDIGSSNNPENRAGLAHFLEHMLFLGTEKYPDANAYSSFIDSHGGSQNAFTAANNTNYFFDIKADALEQGLDRFSQFFIAPLFSEKYTQREKQAVHSEYQSKLQDDGQRNYSAFKQIMNPANPQRHFAVGSLTTLADNDTKIRDDLLAFYHSYYSANRMSLVVLGKESLSDLRSLVTAKFAAVKNLEVTKPANNYTTFADDQLPLMLKVKTLKDYRHLSLSFPTPSTKAYFKEKPLYYISSLVGYEGQGSLTSYLKGLGLINGLSASSSHSSDIESNFQVSFSLTKKGLEQQDKVINSFFNFINKIEQAGIDESLYTEMASLSAQAFQFLSQSNATGYVVQLSQRLKELPQQHWLDVNYLMQGFNKQHISQFLSFIKADNMYVNLQANTLVGDHTEPYFGGQYAVNKVAASTIEKWSKKLDIAELFIRPINPYIATDLNIIPKAKATSLEADNSTVQQYDLTEGVTLWHLQDTQFLTPKANLFFTFIIPDRVLTTKEQLTLSLYVRLVNDKFNELFYDAASAGIYLNLYPHSRGFSLRISGYNQKQPLIIEQLPALADIDLSADRFSILKSNYLRSLSNKTQEKPYQQLLEQLSAHLTGSDNIAQQMSILADLTLDDVTLLAKSLFKQGEIRVLSHGNITLEQAKKQSLELVNQLDITSPIQSNNINQVLTLAAHSDLNIIDNIDSSDSAVALYLQGLDKSYQQRASIDLLTEIISTQYSNQLRTEQQLGYLVFASAMSLQKLPAIVLITQSPHATPEKIQQSNQQFLLDSTSDLANISEQQLLKFKHSLISRYEKKTNTIYQKSSQLWQQINASPIAFDEKQQMIATVEKLTLADLKDSWQQLLLKQFALISYSNTIATQQQSIKSDNSLDILTELKSEQFGR